MMDVEKVVFRSLLAVVAGISAGLLVSSLPEIKRYWRISQM